MHGREFARCLEGGCFLRGLTFDMSGSRKWAKPACDCPFDGRVRPAVRQKQSGGCLLALSGGANQQEQRGVFHEKPQCAGQAPTRQPGLRRSGASQVSSAQECLVFLRACTTGSMASKDGVRSMEGLDPRLGRSSLAAACWH